ncbi:MAG: hypothetical protein LBV68_08165 [Spirochaetaceae bacterium]|jgi:hypothetical protein|nr:hypothetical protein [Spirochaetaceae bacterium]
MTAEMFTFCDFAQENNGKLTIVGTFDTILAKDFPCVHPQLALVIRIRFNISEFSPHAFKIEARDLDGEVCMEPIAGTIDVRGIGNATSVSHLVFNIASFRFNNAGVINFILYIDDREQSSVPLYVRKHHA